MVQHKTLMNTRNQPLKPYRMKANLSWLGALPMLLLFLLPCSTQAQYRVSGSLVDAAGKPLSYANALLLHAADSSLVRGLFTSDDGGYTFENVAAGNFLLRFSLLGHLEFTSAPFSLSAENATQQMEPIRLQENSTALSEVEIRAKRPFLEQKIDRTVVNVANSITNAGGTALEVLQRSPGVQVNQQTKNISLAGKAGVIVMINGKIERLPMEAVVDMLAGMSAENIDHIELIHTPPANFEAEGNAGIIHIVLKNTQGDGINGGYSLNGGYGRGEKYGGSAYFNYRKNKINWFGNYSYNFNLNPQVFTNYRRINQNGMLLETDTYSDRPHTPLPIQNLRLGADFQLTKKTVLGVLGTFFDRDWYMEAENITTYSTDGVVDSLTYMPNTETNHSRSYSTNLNLTHNFSENQRLNLDADIIWFDINNPSYYDVQNQDAGGNLTTRSELGISKNTPIRVFVAKGDYSTSLGEKARLETGLKYTSMRFDNDVRVENRLSGQDWEVMPDFTSFFKLNEKVGGAYLSLTTTILPNTELKAGLRYEYTDTNLGSEEEPNVVDREYGSWFPSVFLTRTLGENRSLNLSYSRRITRPPIQRLAPWLIFSDPTTLLSGNPSIQPAFTDAVRLAYNQNGWNIGLSYSFEDEPIRFVPQVDADNNRQVNTFDNIGNEKMLMANLSFPLRPTEWWEMNHNVYTSFREVNYELEGSAFSINNVNWGFNSTMSFTLPKQFTFEVSGNFDGPGYWGVAYWKGIGTLNLGLEKNLGDKWGKLRLNATNLFMSNNWFGNTEQPEINLFVDFSYQMAERVFMLTWTNTFGNNKVKAARQRQTASAEEQQRL